MKTLCLTACLAAVNGFGASVLDEGALRSYVARFNAGDDEIYSNAVPNAAAAEFLAANVPRFECPDKCIEQTYYFRWWTFRKHLRQTPSGWVITEFLPDVGWAGKANTISCPMGHHQAEGRWLRDGKYVRDYTRFMVTEGRTHEKGAYACWPATGLLKWRDVTGDTPATVALLPDLVRNYEGWEKGWSVKRWPRAGELRVGLCENGMFSISDNYEGMEFSLGGDGYRPIVNCAMESEARAIAEIARLAGETALVEKYSAKANALAKLIRGRLWNRDRQFFTVLSPEGTLASVRELCGYAPWYFGLKLDASYDGVWRHLMREEGFLAPWGLTFPERSAPGFEISYEGHDCLWNGPSWPYATSLALTALARRMQAGGPLPDGLTSSTFACLLRQYAAAHVLTREDGSTVPWIDEDQNPFTGDWVARTKLRRNKQYRIRERGKDYNHSTFCDLVISGLCGLLPKADGSVTAKPLAPDGWDWWCLDGVRCHGRDVTVLFDRDGKRYGRGKGLVVLKDAHKLPCPWVTDEEREAVRGRVCAYDFQPGAPEGDAKRFYSNAEKTEFVEFNYDEAKAGEGQYALEDPLTFVDGRKVKTADDWAARRREILGIFEREVYGRLPPKPDEMTFEVMSEKMSADRFATTRVYRQYFRKDKTGPVVDWFVAVPRHAKGKVPVFLHLNYAGLEKIAAKKTNHYDLPWDMLVANGYAFMSAQYEQITSDLSHGDTVTNAFNGVCELWGRRDPKAGDNPGTLVVWAWGFMRGLDLAGQIAEIDATRNVAIGSSRLGKAALLAAAFDERFTCCVPNQTGAVGVQLMKRDYGENLKGQHLALPHWYCQNVWKYEDDPKSMPFDQHLLLACVAPRNLLLECYHKKWFDPKGEFLAAKAASPVWEFLTGKGLGLDEWPAPYSDVAVRPPFGYVRRTECHGLSPYDWKWAIDFADRVFARDR